MTRSLFTLSVVLVSIAVLISCKKDDTCQPATGINGEWIWEKSVGGFAGATHTPETDNKTQTLVFNDFTVEHYINDTLYISEQYELELLEEPVWGYEARIIYESGREQAIDIGANELKLADQCADCFDHTYRRR